MSKKIAGFISRFYFVIIMIFLYIPILVMIIPSFNKSKSRVVWGGFTTEWYGTVFTNHQIMSALGTTLLLAFASASISLLLGTLGALGISVMRKRGYAISLGIANIPMINADIVTGIALMLFFIKFMNLGTSSVLMAHITFNIPYVLLAVLPKIKQVKYAVYEAARDLGAGPIYAFFTTLLPQLSGGILSGFFMAFTMSMDDFVITYFTKGPGFNTLSTMIYGEMKKGIKPEMYALSTIIFVTVLILLILYNFITEKQAKKSKYVFNA